MKVKGDELLIWMEEDWPGEDDEFCWNHEAFENEPDPTAIYDTDEFSIIYQGAGEDPTKGAGHDLAKLIRAWRKKRSFEIFTIVVPKERAEEIRAAIKALDVTVK